MPFRGLITGFLMAGCPDFGEWGDHVFGPIHSLSLCSQSIHKPVVPALWWMMAKVTDSIRQAVLPELGIRCLSYVPGSSPGKESTCNAGDPGLIPGLGRSAGEGLGHRLQFSWACLVAQLVKKPVAMWETWIWSLGWDDPLEKEKATVSSILAWRIPWTV